MSYWLHSEAEIELAESVSYYRENASLRVAEAFLAELERTLVFLEENQRLGRGVRGGLRSYSLRTFPYSLLYREDSTGPRIYAVAHHKRRPGYWRARL